MFLNILNSKIVSYFVLSNVRQYNRAAGTTYILSIGLARIFHLVQIMSTYSALDPLSSRRLQTQGLIIHRNFVKLWLYLIWRIIHDESVACTARNQRRFHNRRRTGRFTSVRECGLYRFFFFVLY